MSNRGWVLVISLSAGCGSGGNEPTIDASPRIDSPGDGCVSALIEAESISPHTGWVLETSTSYHGGQALMASSVQTVSLGFTGRGFDIGYFVEGDGTGGYNVTIDAISYGVIPSGFGGDEYNVVATGLPNVPHAVTIQCASPNCYLDYYGVLCN